MKKLILASGSPRRRQLLSGLDLPYEVRLLPNIDESYPDDLPAHDVALYCATKKAEAYRPTLADDELVITADTVVVLPEQETGADGAQRASVLGKPHSEAEAEQMLARLSGRTHQVVTGVCLTTREEQRRFDVTTDVTFATLSKEEIHYYVSHYHPMDKAGAYGVQEWIGYVAVSSLNGSFYNVMGFPVQRVYQELMKIMGR